MEKISHIQNAFKFYKKRLYSILGEDLAAVYLYGSHARGTSEEGSDIDVLCVMRNTFDYADLIHRTSEATAEISLSFDVVLSRVFVSLVDYESRQTPFLLNVRKEKVLL